MIIYFVITEVYNSMFATQVCNPSSNLYVLNVSNVEKKDPKLKFQSDVTVTEVQICCQYATIFPYWVWLLYLTYAVVIIGRRKEKWWGALFTGLTTRAIHLEIAMTVSAESFILTSSFLYISGPRPRPIVYLVKCPFGQSSSYLST